jgi:MoaA/NifB/PqqE/SkfB family radical SAM enzyme
MALGAVHFAFQGGEPLVLDNLEEIIGACYPDRNVIAVTTNATLLTISRVHSLRKAGVDLFTISLDSGNPEDHDSFRRHPGAYNKVMEAVRIAREEGVNVTFNAVVSHNNVHSEGLLSLIRMTAGMGVKLNLLYAVPIGEWMNRKDILLTSEDVRCLDRLFESYCHLRRDLDANYQVFGCGAMKEVLYIDCYGDVMPCPYIHASIGNVLEEPLAAIWQRGQTIDHFKAYVPICLAAEDPHFIAEHLSATHEAGRLPVEGARMFPELKASSGDRRS